MGRAHALRLDNARHLKTLVLVLPILASSFSAFAQNLVGSAAGSLSVGANGAANYMIPITVPPGAGGMEPDLELSYDSQAGSGAAGQGFSLTGLGQVSRCAATTINDGFIDPVDFDGNDRFCLDGKRLVVVSGAYGDIGAQYRTENETFSRIETVGGTAGNPAYFIERTKSGLIHYYGGANGSDTTSRFIPPGSGGQTLAWGVSRVEDTTGNYMTVTYTQPAGAEAGEFRPILIHYTGNTGAGIAPGNHIEIEWNYVKPAPNIAYVGGAQTRQGRHISAIRTYSNNVLVRRYALQYANSPSNRRDVLTSFTECGTANQCFPPTVFEWTGTPGSPSFNGAGSGNWTAHGQAFSKNRIADIDGNGYTDFFAVENNTRVRNCISTGSDFDCSTTSSFPGTAHVDLAGDYNADGKTDYASVENFFEPGITPFYLVTGGGSTFRGPNHFCAETEETGDFNGDGYSDLIMIEKQCTNGSNRRVVTLLKNASGWTRPSASTSNVWIGALGDYNGDGRTDRLQFLNGTYTVCLSGEPCATWTGPSMLSGESPVLGDFNSDGMIDVAAYRGGTSWEICPSTGKNFAACTTVTAHSGGSVNNTVADFNGDGFADMAHRVSGSSWNVCIGHGGTGFTCSTRTAPNAAHDVTVAVDLNGDALADLASHISGTQWSVGLASEQKPEMLKAIVNGLGSRTEITYEPLSRIASYLKPTNLSDSIRGLKIPMYVVARTQRNPGSGQHAGSRRAVNYEYAGARMDVMGRGFLGFETRTVTDEMSGNKEITDYFQEFPFSGMPRRVRNFSASGSLMSEENATYGVRIFGSGFSSRHFTFAASAVSDKYEIAPYAQLISRTTTTNTYSDDYGNLAASTITIEGGGRSFTTATTHTYLDDINQWRLGRLVRSEVTRSDDLNAPQTRASAFEYDALTGLIVAEITEPDSPTLRLRKDYQRDAFGNILQTTVSGPGIATRAQLDEYSADGRFKVKSTNSLGHVETRTFAPGTGNVLTATDANGLLTTYQYDAIGRLTQQSFSQHGISKTTTTTRRLCSQTTACISSSDVYTIETAQSSGERVTVVHDVVDRATAKLLHSPSGTILIRTEYDLEDQVLRTSSPTLAGPSSLYWTTFIYDDMGRVLQENSPIDRNTPSGRITRYEYDGLVTRQFDALNRLTTKVKDVLGRSVSVTDALGGQVRFGHDAFDNLIESVDAGGSVTTLQYNIRGHKTAMSDPNMGTWTYEYDTLGQLLRQVDAKAQITTMQYDLLGRMISRTEAEGVTTWTYDSRWKGALTQVESPGYSRAYTYFAHGGIQNEITRIASADTPPGVAAITAFSAAPNDLPAGQNTTLSWTTADTQSCQAGGNLPGWSGNKVLNGSQSLLQVSAGTYTAQLSCEDQFGNIATRSVSVTVRPSSGTAVISNFAANPTTFFVGESTTLTWSSTGTVGCTASGTLPGWTGAKSVSGFQGLTVNTAGSYTAQLTCTDSNGLSAARSLSINVQIPPPVAITSFTATPSTINENESTTLKWTTTRAVSCSATGQLPGWPGNKPINASQTLYQESPGDFTARLTCQDAYNRTVTQTLRVTVKDCLIPLGTCVNPPARTPDIDAGLPELAVIDDPELPVSFALPHDTVYAPLVDLNGTFVVSWGASLEQATDAPDEYCRLQTAQCTQRNTTYELQIATNSSFIGALDVYSGPSRQFRLTGLSPGKYFFRYRAKYEVCVRLIGPNTCDARYPEDMEWEDRTTNYQSNGQNSTLVGSGEQPIAFDDFPPIGNNPQATSSSEGDPTPPNESFTEAQSLSDGFVEFVTSYTYDTHGRTAQIAYPSGFRLEHSYHAAGPLEKVYDPATPGTPYWTAQSWDEWGNVTQSRLRNGVDTLRDYDSAVGRLTTIMAGQSGGSDIQSLGYGYDALDNLTHRLDNNQGGLREDFEYDVLNRLTRSTLSGVIGMSGPVENLTMSYAANGNILNKSGVGAYTYDLARPHAVSTAGGINYQYDANGNQTQGAGRTLTWSSYNLPVRIAQTNGNFSEWHYGSERQRIRQLSKDGNVQKLTYYPSALYEEQRRGSAIEQKHYISTPEGVVAIETWWNSGAVQRDYLHMDHLGSIDTISNDAGQITQKLSYDAFGKRRGSQWQGSPGLSTLLPTQHGYTGHEMLDSVGLIHMNGRVYDPHLARFLSADPILQAPELTQSHNRYSYVMNNPLTLTDPSGYSWLKKTFKKIGKWLKKNWRAIAAIAIAAIAPYALGTGFWGSVGAGFTSGLVASGGDLKTALISAVTAGLFHGIGSKFQALESKGALSLQLQVEKIFAHGAVGGLSSVAQGGKFGAGFLSSAVPQAATQFMPDQIQPKTYTESVIQASVLGGTASALGGGKFANGAVTGAFSYAFGSVARDMQNGASFGEAMLDLAGKVWALPNTVMGLAVGGVSYGVGWAGYGLGLLDVAPSISIGNNAIQFENIPFGTGALTLGNTIIYGGGTAPNQMGNLYGDRRYLNVGLHEMGHTYQYQAYGPFFLPAYFLRGGISAINPFEQGANNYAAGGSGRP